MLLWSLSSEQEPCTLCRWALPSRPSTVVCSLHLQAEPEPPAVAAFGQTGIWKNMYTVSLLVFSCCLIRFAFDRFILFYFRCHVLAM